MRNNSKNNSIIFLTTLSVYLGLVLVGGIPSVSAHQTEIISRQSKISEDQISKGGCSETSIAEILEIIAKYDVNQIPLSFTYRINYSETKSPSLEILLAEGNEFSTESLRQIVTCNVNLLKQLENKRAENKDSRDFAEAMLKALFPFDSVLCFVSANNQEIVSEVTYSFVTKEQAKNYAQSVDAQTHKIKNSELIAKNRVIDFISKNTQTRSENNQVFIVTRLPRGSLDELLKQDAKADQ